MQRDRLQIQSTAEVDGCDDVPAEVQNLIPEHCPRVVEVIYDVHQEHAARGVGHDPKFNNGSNNRVPGRADNYTSPRDIDEPRCILTQEPKTPLRYAQHSRQSPHTSNAPPPQTTTRKQKER